jgi:predicted Holliday junction resolvase-like endonuclease
MLMLWALIILGVIVVLLLVLLVRQSTRLSSLSRRYDADIRKARSQSVKQSRAIQLGGIAEQMAPLLPGFPFDPKDCRWAGQPIDMIVFDGLEAGGDVSIVLLEVKTGTGSLNGNQRRVRDAVDAGRVEFRVFRPDRQWGIGEAVEILEITPEDLEDPDEEPAGWEEEIEDVTVASDPPSLSGEPA